MRFVRSLQVFRVALIVAPLSLGLAACETLDALQSLNPLEEKKTPIAGDRRQLFPQGVPGIEYNAPPQQPSNSNMQIVPQQQPAPDANPDAQVQRTPNAPAANNNPNEDPWAGQRGR